MPPKIDPYDTPRAKIFDAFLCFLILIVLAVLLATAPAHRAESSTRHPLHSDQAAR